MTWVFWNILAPHEIVNNSLDKRSLATLHPAELVMSGPPRKPLLISMLCIDMIWLWDAISNIAIWTDKPPSHICSAQHGREILWQDHTEGRLFPTMLGAVHRHVWSWTLYHCTQFAKHKLHNGTFVEVSILQPSIPLSMRPISASKKVVGTCFLNSPLQAKYTAQVRCRSSLEDWIWN